MRSFGGIVLFVAAATLYIGGAIGVFLLILSLVLAVVYGPDWSALR